MNAYEPVHMFAIGDGGGTNRFPFYTRKQLHVAKQMQLYAAHTNVSFVLSLGDNFYPNGVESPTDERFKQTFEDIYVKESLKSTPWFVIAGNHDHRNRLVDSQIKYSELSNVWKFPGYIHMLKLKIRGQKKVVTVKFIMIDTSIMCNLYEFNNSSPNILNKTYFEAIEQALKENTVKTDLKILVGHHPIYTAMEQRKNSQCMNQNLLKLMKTYSINSYICGHDHTLQYSSVKVRDTHQLIHLFVSGAGKELYNSPRIFEDESSKQQIDKVKTDFYWSRQNDDSAGFMSISFYLNKFIATFINTKGVNLFSKEIHF